jgi:hypothetical protein
MAIARLHHASAGDRHEAWAPSAAGCPPLTRLEIGLRAVERAIEDLGLDAPHALRSPLPVEEAIAASGSTILSRSLLILDPAELRSAEVDLEETVADERAGGSLFVSVPNPAELLERRTRYRDLAVSTAAFAFVDGDDPRGLGRFTAVRRPTFLRRYRLVVADTPGFRVAVASRGIAGRPGFVGLWTGDEEMVDEVAGCLRTVARSQGHVVPDAAPSIPPLSGIQSERDVWRQALALRGLREVREGELREIARAAALRGVALRRERAARAGAA